jgi:hypothetical protein
MVTEYETAATWPLPFGERAELELKSDLGSIHLEPVATGEEPRIEATGHDAGRITVNIRRDGDLVKVKIDQGHSNRRMWGSWDARITVYLPRDVRAAVHTDAGSVEARDLGPCELKLTSDAGRIQLRNVRGRLRLATDAGQVTGKGLAGSFDVETDAGKVDLAIDALDPGEHQVRTDVGAIRVDLARGLDVRVETRASVGSVRCDYPSRPDAPAVLRVSTDVGTVRVREAGAGDGPESWAWATAGVEHGWPSPPPPPVPPTPPFGFQSEPRQSGGEAGGEPGPRAGRSAGSGSRPTSLEVERILKMVEAGELSARDADELLRAMDRE